MKAERSAAFGVLILAVIAVALVMPSTVQAKHARAVSPDLARRSGKRSGLDYNCCLAEVLDPTGAGVL